MEWDDVCEYCKGYETSLQECACKKHYWNHRIVEKDGSYGVHEVHYNGSDEPIACTVNPITLVSEDYKDLKWEYDTIAKAFSKPTLSYWSIGLKTSEGKKEHE